MGMFDDVPMAAPAARGGGMFDDIPMASAGQREDNKSSFWGRARDIGRSIEEGGDRALASVLGAPADILSGGQAALNWAQAHGQGRSFADVQAENDKGALLSRETVDRFGSKAVRQMMEASRPVYEPQTTAGKYARSAADFATQTAIMPGRTAANVVKYGLAPGLASEAAGQATEGTSAEPWARAGAALGTAGIAALAPSRTTAAQTVGRAAGEIAPAEREAALARFDGLMSDAQANQIPLSPAFAWDAATNGASDMAGLYRHAEAMGRMRGFNAQMPDAVDRAARAQFDTIAPVDSLPSQLGERTAETARGALDASPAGRNLEEALRGAGPRVTPDQAGQVIQRDLRGVQDARETVRSTQADRDYGAARAAPENVGIERTITVERPGEPIISQPRYSRPQFGDGAPRPLDPPPTVEAGASAGPESLARFIARNGGLRLDGDVLATDLHRFNVPGLGNVARQDGKSLDNFWRERLIEEGYFKRDADGGAARDISSELLRKLQNEQRGYPSYPAGAERQAASARAAPGQVADEYRAALSQAERRLDDDLGKAGIDPASLHPEIRSRTLGAIMRGEHVDPLDAYERTVGAMRDNPAPLSRATTVTEEIPDVRFGQVNPQPALNAIERQARTAKGDVRSSLESARRDLYEPGIDPASGIRETDMSVEGLLHARERLDYQIQAAHDVGDRTKVRDLQVVRTTLDRQLKTVPSVAAADSNFAERSIPLQPFGGNAPLGRVTARDDLTGRMQTPAEQVPSYLAGATATREALANGTPATREALQGRTVTQILDAARDFRGAVSSERLRNAMRENEDVLGQFPEAREQLNRIALAQDGRDALRGTLVGRLAERDTTTAQAISILFPKGGELLANGEREIGAAVGTLARQNATVARQLVRAKAENLFNAATKDVQSGANEMGGAKYRMQLVGNSQEAANFAAAVRALPEGDTVADGFGRFLDVLKATGLRQNVGSRTAYNQEFLEAAREGGKVEGVARLAAGGFVKFPAKVQERLERWRLGRNVDELARLFSDLDAIGAFRGLVAAGDRGGDIRGPVARLVAIAARGAQAPAPLQISVRPGESRQ